MVLNDILSEKIIVESVFPLGTVFGLLLSNLYINNMHEKDNKTVLIQNADDTVIFTSGRSNGKSKKQLSSCVMKLTSYLKEHQLSINASKTEFLVFDKIVRKNQKERLQFDGALVEKKQEIKYLGAQIEENIPEQSRIFDLKNWFVEKKSYKPFAIYPDHHKMTWSTLQSRRTTNSL